MLDRIRIASPCSASWELMKGDDQVRFCSHCEKHVYNLSAMTRKDADTLIRETEARVCTLFYRRSDGTMLTQDCPVGLKAKVARVRRRLEFAMSGLLSLAGVASAQTQPNQSLVQLVQSLRPQVRGVVKDPTGAVIPRAQVILTNQQTGAAVVGMSNESGEFRLEAQENGLYTLKVQVPGFSSFEKKGMALRGVARVDVQVELALGTMGGPVVVEKPSVLRKLFHLL